MDVRLVPLPQEQDVQTFCADKVVSVRTFIIYHGFRLSIRCQ
jgi:hypothetical protein